MRKARIFLLLLGLCWVCGQGMFLYAQEQDEDENSGDNDDIPLESEWDEYLPEIYSRGDQTFVMAVGVNFPTVFFNNREVIAHHISPPIGGILSLSYNRFLGAHFFLGAEIGFYFDHTLGQNTVFLIPIGARAGWQFVFQRFEFPLGLTVGFAPQKYLSNSYTGLFVKGQGSAFFRFSSNWSFGLNADWSCFPQWPKEDGARVPHKDMYANFLGLTLSARYHF